MLPAQMPPSLTPPQTPAGQMPPPSYYDAYGGRWHARASLPAEEVAASPMAADGALHKRTLAHSQPYMPGQPEGPALAPAVSGAAKPAPLAAPPHDLLGGSPAGGTAELCLSLDDFTSTFNPNELVDLLDDLDDLK